MYSEGAAGGWVGAFKVGGERRGGGVGRLIEGGGVGRVDGKNLQILDLHRLASLKMIPFVKSFQFTTTSCSSTKKVTEQFAIDERNE